MTKRGAEHIPVQKRAGAGSIDSLPTTLSLSLSLSVSRPSNLTENKLDFSPSFLPSFLPSSSKMHGGPSGLHNAPATRSFLIGSALLSIVFAVRRRPTRLGLSYQDVFKQLHLRRIIASEFAFSSTPELIFGLYLLYYFRVFERQVGSNKYSVFIIFSMILTLLFKVVALVLLKDQTSVLSSGPYGLIFASFVSFYLDIPVSSRFQVFGIHFTDKTFTYLAGLQLLLSSWKQSLVPGLCGVLAGFLYRANIFHIRRIKFPQFIASFFSRLSWSSGSSLHTSLSWNVRRNIHSHAGRQAERNYPSGARATPEPPESSVAALVSMGFDSNSARQALLRARNDINVATNILLEAQSQ